MGSIVYRVKGQKGRWFIEHSGGRFGPLRTKADAISLAKAAAGEGKQHGIEVAVESTADGQDQAAECD